MHQKNIERAERIARLINGYPDFHHSPSTEPVKEDAELEDCVVNVLTDLMHLTTNWAAYLDELMEVARTHYEHERDNEGVSVGDMPEQPSPL